MKDSNNLPRLVERAQQGDEDAFAEIYSQCSKSVYFNAYKFLGNDSDAKDILQEVMIELFQNIRGIQNPQALNFYLYRATYHRSMNFIKKNRAELHGEDAEQLLDNALEENVEFIPQEFAETRESRETIAKLVGELRPNYRAALTLYYFDELSVQEIADVMGVTVYAVKVWLQRGRAALRKRLEQDAPREGVLRAMSVPVLTVVLRESANGVFTTEVSAAAWEIIAGQMGFSAATAATAVKGALSGGGTAGGAAGGTAAGGLAGAKLVAVLLVSGAVTASAILGGTQLLKNRDGPNAQDAAPANYDISSGNDSGDDINPSSNVSDKTAAPHTPPDSAEATTSTESSDTDEVPVDLDQAPIAVTQDVLTYPRGSALSARQIMQDAGVISAHQSDDIAVIGLEQVDTDQPNHYAVLLRVPDGQQCAVVIIITE